MAATVHMNNLFKKTYTINLPIHIILIYLYVVIYLYTLYKYTHTYIERSYSSNRHLAISPADGVVDSKAVDWYRRRRFESPRCQWGFSNSPWLNIAHVCCRWRWFPAMLRAGSTVRTMTCSWTRPTNSSAKTSTSKSRFWTGGDCLRDSRFGFTGGRASVYFSR